MRTPTVPGYELRRPLGRGGMGEVWLAMRPTVEGFAKAVAIKVVPIDALDRRAFLDEARVSTLLSHSNIVQVFDVGTTASTGYLVMEVVDGVDLSHLAKTLAAVGERVPLHVVVYVITQLLRALEYAHALQHQGAALGIVHRDVSPHNVLISVSGEVKLLDFGIARSKLDQTAGLKIKGKLRYMAPEQFAGGIVDARADLYATGVLLHELLAGQPFRRGASVPELYAELSSPVVPALPFAVPHVIDAVRARLLQPQVSARFNSASEALAMLHGSPDARDASTELAALCRRITGVQAPRSDLGSSGPGGRPSKGAHDRTRRACVAHGRRFCGAPLAVARGG